MAEPQLGAIPTGARGRLHPSVRAAVRVFLHRRSWSTTLIPSSSSSRSARRASMGRLQRRASLFSGLLVLLMLLPNLAAAQEPVPAAEPAAELVAAELAFVPETVDAAFAPAPVNLATSAPVVTATMGAEMLLREVSLIAQVNAHRRAAGLAPVRWNRELSEASRWFARDAVITKPVCSHTDSLGRGPGSRLRAFGYQDPVKWNELIACGFTEPAAVVQAWMNTPDQRVLLLDPELREAGPGYFYSNELQRGYVVLKLSGDDSFAPIVINDENAQTTSAQVTVSILPQAHNPVEMKISNSASFAGAAWEPFVSERSWTLTAEPGWKTVYVLTRDRVGHTTLLTDVIYFGPSLPIEQLTLDHAANIGSAFAIREWPFDTGAVNSVRLSMGWVMDGVLSTFTLYRGAGQEVANPAAVGGTELLLPGGSRDAYLRGSMTNVPANRILTAYYRLKVADNSSADAAIQLTVRADGRIFGPLLIAPNQFKAAGVWQDFGVTFAFSSVNSLPTVDVELQRIGRTDVTFDGVRFFGQPMALESPLLWSAGNGPFRSQGVQARFESDAGLSEPFDVAFTPIDDVSSLNDGAAPLEAFPASVLFAAADSSGAAQQAVVVVCPLSCPDESWTAVSSASWLTYERLTDGLWLVANPAGLAAGAYDGFITVSKQAAANAAAAGAAAGAVVAQEGAVSTMVAVRLVVGAPPAGVQPAPPPAVELSSIFMPLVHR